MAKEPENSVEHHDSFEKAVLRALSSIVGIGDATVQVYTSKRGRTWCTVRSFGERIYTSAVECDQPCTSTALALALGHACFIHARKRTGGVPMMDTWTPSREANSGQELLAKWLDAGELPTPEAEDDPLGK